MALTSMRRAAQQLAGSALQQRVACFATKAADTPVVKKDWNSVKLPKNVVESIPTTVAGGQAFGNDLRGTSGLGLGDGIRTHTDKWLAPGHKSPMEYIQEAEPIKVSGAVVASYGSEDPALGCPVEFINLKGTSKENPAVCKYTGNRYYSEDWKYAH